MLKFGLIHLRYRGITFFLYFLIATFTTPSRLVSEDTTSLLFAIALAIGAVVTLLTLPFLALACYLIRKYRLGRKSILFPIGLIALVGAIRGLILPLASESLGVEVALSGARGILTSVIFILIYFVGISTLVEVLSQKKQKFTSVFNQATENLSQSSDQLLGNDPQHTYEKAIASVKQAVMQGSSFEAREPIDPKVAAIEIQKQINEVLRPLSHRLWVNSLGQLKYRSIKAIVRDVMEDIDVNFKLLLSFQLLFGGFAISLVFDARSVLVISFIAAVTTTLLTAVFFQLKARTTKHQLALGIAYLLAISLLPVLVPIVVREPLSQTFSLVLGIALSPILPGFIFLASTFRLISLDRDFAISAATSVSSRVSTTGLQLEQTQEEEDLAEYFHNSLQSELFGISKQLEALDLENNHQETHALLDSFYQALDRTYLETKPKESDGLIRIEKLVESWKGICSISISGLNLLESKSQLAFKVSRLAEELTTNSVRYGEASEIEISLSLDGDQLQILLTHNGKQEVQSKNGLGTLLVGRYSREGVTAEIQNEKTYYKISLN